MAPARSLVGVHDVCTTFTVSNVRSKERFLLHRCCEHVFSPYLGALQAGYDIRRTASYSFGVVFSSPMYDYYVQFSESFLINSVNSFTFPQVIPIQFPLLTLERSYKLQD